MKTVNVSPFSPLLSLFLLSPPSSPHCRYHNCHAHRQYCLLAGSRSQYGSPECPLYDCHAHLPSLTLLQIHCCSSRGRDYCKCILQYFLICGSPMQVEIEHCSVAYFDRITTFEALQCRTSVKGRAYTRCVNVASIDEFTQRVWVLPLTEAPHQSASNKAMRTKYATE